jgi:hypothetical protein
MQIKKGCDTIKENGSSIVSDIRLDWMKAGKTAFTTTHSRTGERCGCVFVGKTALICKGFVNDFGVRD